MIVTLQQPPDRKCSPPNLDGRTHPNLPSKRRGGLSSSPGARAVFMSMKPSLNWLLPLVPVAIALRYWPAIANPTALFICSAIAIVPVAGWIGRATEELAARVGEGLGGLLNATLGNAAELIIAGIALSKGLTSVVKASITGSIIGNILLVLGLSILLGGLRHKEQLFNKTGARTSVISLSLAAIALVIPTVFHLAASGSPGGWSPVMERQLSLGISVVLFITYICLLAFTLRTHKHFFVGVEAELEERAARWTKSKAVVVLLIATGIVALLSEFLVGTIESVRASIGVTEVFVGVIVVVVVGKDAEQYKDEPMPLKK